MNCHKLKYDDEIAAKLALANVTHQDSSRREKSEKRYYLHKKEKGGCGYYHLTSQAFDPDKRKNSRLRAEASA